MVKTLQTISNLIHMTAPAGPPVFEPKFRGKDGLNTFDRLTKSRIILLTKYPFFGSLALHLQLVEIKDSKKCPTAATDGKHFFYNPDFIDSLDDPEVNWVMCHEVLHPALGHLWRRGSRTPTRFNYAADYAIHCIMQEMSQKHPADFRMPKLCLYDAKYDGFSAEEIYEQLEDEETLKLKGGGLSGQGTLDSHDPWDDANDGADGQNQEQDWQGRVVSAAQTQESKNKGDLPGGIKRLLGKITKPQKNWKQLLAEFVQFEIFDYAFNPPDKRLYGLSDYIGTDIILPDYSDETSVIRNLIFAIDTSGSIDDKQLSVFINEGIGLLNQYAQQVTGKVIYCDADVAAIYPIEEIGERPPAGGGGTDFKPVFDWIAKYEAENGIEVCGVVYLTDMYGSFPKKKPHYPVLWVSTTPISQIVGSHWDPPFGQLTELKIS